MRCSVEIIDSHKMVAYCHVDHIIEYNDRSPLRTELTINSLVEVILAENTEMDIEEGNQKS